MEQDGVDSHPELVSYSDIPPDDPIIFVSPKIDQWPVGCPGCECHFFFPAPGAATNATSFAWKLKPKCPNCGEVLVYSVAGKDTRRHHGLRT